MSRKPGTSQPSGASNERKRQSKLTASLAAEVERWQSGGRELPPHLQAYSDLGPPPTDTLEAMIWWRDVLSTLAHHALIDVTITEEDRRSTIAALGKVAAALAPRSSYEEKIKKIAERVYAAPSNGPRDNGLTRYTPTDPKKTTP